MKNKALMQIIFIIVGSLLVSCCAQEAVKPAVETANTEILGVSEFFNNVLLVSGIDFKTGKSFVINPITGKEQQPCRQEAIIVNTDKPSQPTYRKEGLKNEKISNATTKPQHSDECNIKIVNPSPELANAIQSSEKIIDGTVRKGGKDIPARFVVSITALYPGSNCATYYSGGKEYKYCSDTQANCNLVSPTINPASAGYGVSSNESFRRAVRKVCRQFSTWKTSDCQYLKTRYSTAPLSTMYSTKYKQYIWKTCKGINPSWGTCPAPVSTDKTISECVNPIETP
jgi:hypothetical protein